MRVSLGARRAARDPEERESDDAARTKRVLTALADRPDAVIAAYFSRPPEPDTHALVAALIDRGHRVLLPLLSVGPCIEGRREVGWAWYTGVEPMVSRVFGIAESVAERLGPQSLSQADVILISGLSATVRGDRLGVGSGWFDRALKHARPDSERWLLLNDDEIIEELPQEDHDELVDAIITASGIIHTQRRN